MTVEDIKVIGNLGTGTMGFGTALMFALKGYEVRLFGRSDSSIERGLRSIREALDMYERHGLVVSEEIPSVFGRITGVTRIEEAVREADFVIESVAEELSVKQQVWKIAEAAAPVRAIFATNTSGLSPTAIAEFLDHKERFIVAHFWNPPHLIPLVEVVPGQETNAETVEITWQLMEQLGKKPVALKREAPGFIGNRLQLALLREAMHIVEEGIATPEAVDRAVKYGIGRRLATSGPLESADLGGLDIFYRIASYLYGELSTVKEPGPLLSDCAAQGKLGAKTGQGVYQWAPDMLQAMQQRRQDVLLEWLQKDKTIEF